jgi:alpha-amylase
MQEQTPTPENMTMMQAFEWYVPADCKHWKRLESQLPQLKAFGIDNFWIPPGCKASFSSSNGYDVYDLYDLGEFDQKGGRATKWGTKEELLSLIAKAKEVGAGMYWDAVLNHKAAADHKEVCRVQEVDSNDRTKTISDPYDIEAWVGFDFPGRGDKYSAQKYHWYHFTGTDYDARNNRSAIFKILGSAQKDWAHPGDVDSEKGNYDYLMFADLDYAHPEVKADVLKWGAWMSTEIGITGIRFDAVKHFSEDFLCEFIVNMDDIKGDAWFYVGDFWKDSLEDMSRYLRRMGEKFSLFDAPLVYNFSELSKTMSGDLRTVFDGTLVKNEPVNAVVSSRRRSTHVSVSRS